MFTPTDRVESYGITAPYTIPKIFLPTHTGNLSTAPLPAPLMRRVARLNNRLSETLRQLQQYLLPLSALRNQVVIIRAILNEIYEETAPALAELNDTYGLADNRTIQEQTLPDWDRHHLGGYIVYDEYFSIIRVPELTPVQLLCQCVATTYAMLGDLPFTMLAREEIEVLFTAFHKMYGIFLPVAQPDIPPVPAAYIQHEHNNLAATDLLWTTLATDESQRKNIAMFRWLVGHHIFNTVTIFLTYALQEAITALENNDEAQVITQLDRAATFLRAGIACEWYAANFSSDIYADIVRPSMVMQDVPGGDGFSGDQNAEFNRFKYMKEQLKRAMQKRQGTLSPQVQQALRQFVEMYVQDGEHHVLLASAMTGNSPSIAQEVWMEDLPDGTPVQSAVDFLRNMVLSRRAEFSHPTKKDTQPLLDPVAPMDIDKDTTGLIIGTVDDMAETRLLLREINGDDYLIGCTDGEYWAVSATCTHKEFSISEIPDENGCMVCTKHGAVFEPGTGKNLRGPVGTTDLPRYNVINDNGVLKIQGIPQK